MEKEVDERNMKVLCENEPEFRQSGLLALIGLPQI